MLLSIDIGNTNVKVGIIGQQFVLQKTSIPKELFNGENNPFAGLFSDAKINRIVVMSVVPDITERVVTAASRYFGPEPVLITNAVEAGVKFNIKYPERVGIDRVAVALASFEALKGPTLTVDFGTVTSMSVMDKDGVFSGGALFPGVSLITESLHSHTALLPAVHFDGLKKPSALGKHTEEAILSGIFYGTSGAVDTITCETERELGYNIRVVITGGGAPVMESFLKRVDLVDLDLSLKGLMLLYERLNK
ncbi:MAG: type III pantothenate kinase [Nitrospirae bacterium]|nr:type III pantothenate kinase [Nitrospirota bacterium]MBF0533656.1 type III pantothenate kinase [Nitrospirota bacterium]MBF0616693.1 type III pantothenate kinase [Nitrospirota bacterium]